MGTVFCWPSKTFDNSEDVDIALLHSIYENTSSSVCNTIQQTINHHQELFVNMLTQKYHMIYCDDSKVFYVYYLFY
jgi:hypothetical protein